MEMLTKRRIVFGSTAIALVLFFATVVYPRIGDSRTGDARGAAANSTQGPRGIGISPDRALPVVGATVVQGTLAISVSAAGQAAADQRTTLVSQVEGPVSQVLIREAERVQVGQVMLTIDSTEYALRVASAQARLAQAEARFRELTLFDDDITDPEVRAERARVSRGKSGLEEAEVGLRLARLEFQRAIVRAPFAGRIADLRVVPGQWVTRQSELTTVVDLNPIRLEVQVVETAVGLVSAGRSARVVFAAFPGETFIGQIASINPVIEPQSRTGRVTVTVPNPDGRILPGMTARVSLEAETLMDRVLVPRAAVLQQDSRSIVFAFEGNGDVGIARERRVMTGLSNDSLVEIVASPEVEGVEPGDVVLIEGHYTLRAGTPVRLLRRTGVHER